MYLYFLRSSKDTEGCTFTDSPMIIQYAYMRAELYTNTIHEYTLITITFVYMYIVSEYIYFYET